MGGREKRNRPRESFWRKAVERQRASGLSAKEFSEREGFNEGTFSWWRTQIAKRDRAAGVVQPFVPVVCEKDAEPPKAANGAVAEIDLDARVLRIFNGVEVATLRSLLEALRG